jgi:LysM repeat protein
MPLTKLKIKNVDNNDEFDVLFNPTEYTVEDSNSWEEKKKARQKPELQFTGLSLKKLSMELFIDTYEQKDDVRRHTGKLAKLLIASINDGNRGSRPPKLRLLWGKADPNTPSDFPFDCVLESLKQQFTLFANDGTPVRAKLNVSFKEFRQPTEQARRLPRPGSFPDQTYTVKAGDTLSGITATLWQDPLKWRIIADKNAIANPRILSPGQILQIPAIE